MFNRRSFLALLGLVPILKVKPKPQVTLQYHLAITEPLAPGQSRLSRPPLMGTVHINYQDMVIVDDANGNLRTTLTGTLHDLDACPVVGTVDYTTGVMTLKLSPHPGMARYQALSEHLHV